MPNCRDIEPLITPYLDDEATSDQASSVAAHLLVCQPCRARAAAERAARLILHERARALRIDAPPRLIARCEASAAATRLPGWRRRTTESLTAWSWLTARPVSMMATASIVVLIVAAIVFSAAGGSKVLAAELAFDHVKCFALFERSSGPGDSAAIAARMKAVYGWNLRVPATADALKLRLVGGRRCISTDGRVAHILYRYQGRALSLFVLPSATMSAAQLGVIGHEAIIWSAGGNTYAVVARAPGRDVTRVADYFKSIVD